MSWHAMDTAPMDRLVLLVEEGAVGVGRHSTGKYWEFANMENDTMFAEPTLWCEIPPLPETQP